MKQANPSDSAAGPERSAALARQLSERLGCDVAVTVTDSRRQMISCRKRRQDRIQVRVHHMFLDAPEKVLDALADYLEHRGNPRPVLRTYIRNHLHLIRRREPGVRKRILRPLGNVYDLREIHGGVNQTYFEGRSTARVTWGRAIRRDRVKGILFGSYRAAENLITISRRLDSREVPRYVLEFIMYHEVLHEILGTPQGINGRRQLHTAEFRRRERTFPRYEEVLAFQHRKWGVILRDR